MRVLLVFKGFFGDLILGTPVIRALKEHAGVTHISILTPPIGAALLGRDPLVDEILTLDRKRTKGLWALKQFAGELRSRRYDRAYSFHRSPRTAMLLFLAGIPDRVAYDSAYLSILYKRLVPKSADMHEVLRSLELVLPDLDSAGRRAFDELRHGEGVSDIGDLRLSAPNFEELSPDVQALLQVETPHIVVSPGSAWETKRWDAQGFADVCASVSAAGVRPILVGARSDAAACAEVAARAATLGATVTDLCGQTSIPDLLQLIRTASCVVCNDSMALHVASAFKVPTVAVFCATSPKFGFGPWQNEAIVIERQDLFCKPCSRHGAKVCPMGTRACMVGVQSGDIIGAVRKFLGKSFKTLNVAGVQTDPR